MSLLRAVAPRLRDTQFDAFMAFMAFIKDSKSTRCEPHGFDCYNRVMDLPTKAKAHACYEGLSPQQ